jgi:putative lipase involved disintegration of autophagic bodies
LSIKIYENIQKLSAKYPVERIVGTGHSLGGALALVAGLDIKMNYGNKFEV